MITADLSYYTSDTSHITVDGGSFCTLTPADIAFITASLWEHPDRTLTAGPYSLSFTSGSVPAEVATEVLAQAQVTPIHADMRKTMGTALKGDGTVPNKFRSTLVP